MRNTKVLVSKYNLGSFQRKSVIRNNNSNSAFQRKLSLEPKLIIACFHGFVTDFSELNLWTMSMFQLKFFSTFFFLCGSLHVWVEQDPYLSAVQVFISWTSFKTTRKMHKNQICHHGSFPQQNKRRHDKRFWPEISFYINASSFTSYSWIKPLLMCPWNS